MQKPHIILHLSILPLLHDLLTLLPHRFIIQYNVLHLLMIKFFIAFAHHPLKLLRVEIVPDQLTKLVGALGSQFLENFFGFPFRIGMLEGFP